MKDYMHEMVDETCLTYSETYYLLHRLWSQAVGTRQYIKKEWQKLEAYVKTTTRQAGRPLTLDPRDDAKLRQRR